MSHSAQQRKQGKQGKPRTPKKDATRAAASANSGAATPPAPKLSPRAAAFRARRGGAAAQATAVTLSREQEMVYIRDDLRRLIYVASGLLVLMVVILYIIER
ncbi:MAG: hypothetical protein R2853_03345 [Thermomicrobiales bacterium]